MKVFELCLENDPSSDRALDGLGQAYRALGEADRARAAFLRALELNPWNREAREAAR